MVSRGTKGMEPRKGGREGGGGGGPPRALGGLKRPLAG